MSLKNFVLIVLFCLFVSPLIHALKREDYYWSYIDLSGYPQVFYNYCPEHTNIISNLQRGEIKKYKYKMNILNKHIKLLPKLIEKCEDCSSKAIYRGYFDPYVDRYFTYFESYLKYVSDHKECSCYWPELSIEAAKINDLAYDLFYDLILNTKLCHINEHGFLFYDDLMYTWQYALDNIDQLDKRYLSFKYLQFERFFEHIPRLGIEIMNTTVCFVSHNFFYSNYYNTCQDIYEYSLRNFDIEECYKIQDKLNYILQTLSPHFVMLYDKCLERHANPQIEMERYIAKFNLSL